MKVYIVIILTVLVAGCGESEVEDYSAYNVNIVIGDKWYEVDGRRSTDLLALYHAKASTISEKEKIQVVLSVSADNNIGYERVKESVEELKNAGIKTVALASGE